MSMVDAFYELCGHREKERCPCCDHLTLSERGGYEICPICFWEDDGTNDVFRESPFSPNHCTLLDGRRQYLVCRSSKERMLEHCRHPTEQEAQERAAWRSTIASRLPVAPPQEKEP